LDINRGRIGQRTRKSTHGTLKFHVMPDTQFVADKPISAYADVARSRGLIIT
jgi:hypothetical protein